MTRTLLTALVDGCVALVIDKGDSFHMLIDRDRFRDVQQLRKDQVTLEPLSATPKEVYWRFVSIVGMHHNVEAELFLRQVEGDFFEEIT